MKIFLNKLSTFDVAVLVRFLYRSGILDDLNIDKIFYNSKISRYHISIYGRLDPELVNNMLIEDIPYFGRSLVIYRSDRNDFSKNIDLNGYDTIIIDGSGDYIRKYNTISVNISNSIGYNAISFFYVYYLRKKEYLPKKHLHNKVDKISRYIARKLLNIIEPDNIDILRMKTLLLHVYKQFKYIPKIKDVVFKGDNHVEITILVYNNTMKLSNKVRLEYRDGYLKFG